MQATLGKGLQIVNVRDQAFDIQASRFDVHCGQPMKKGRPKAPFRSGLGWVGNLPTRPQQE
jgi:hypothetical protein